MGLNGTLSGDIGQLTELHLLYVLLSASLGGLSKLYWLDLADNQLSGPLPVSHNKVPGLDQLIVTEVKTAMNKDDEEYYGLKELMDPLIRNNTYLIGFRKYVELAMKCVKEPAEDRPTMSEVVKEIEAVLNDNVLNAISTSTSSSTMDFIATKKPFCLPCDDLLPTKDINSNSFENSGGYTLPTKIEPK